MKIVMFVALALLPLAAAAADGSQLLQTLREQASHVRLAYQEMAEQKRAAEEQIAMHGPGAAQMPTGHNVRVAMRPARAEGIAASRKWMAGKSQADQDAAKKLQAAFLVYLRSMRGCGPCDPAEQTADAKANEAYDKAESEFKVATGTT